MSGPGPDRLASIIEEFADCDLRERLELLLDFSTRLPPLPAELQAEREAGQQRVHECMTPVFLWISVAADRVAIQADVAPEAPTVKGFVSLLIEAFGGATPEQVLAAPADLIQRLGLAEALGMQRMRGLHAILHRIRQAVGRSLNQA